MLNSEFKILQKKIKMIKAFNNIIIGLLILFIYLYINNITGVKCQQVPLEPLTLDEAEIIIKEININKQGTPVFTLYSKLFKLCENNNICGPGSQNEFVPVTAIIVFEGENSSRSEKASIVWEVRFKNLAPAKIVYGEKPFNARQMIAPKPLEYAQTYTICLYPRESVLNCTKWVYDYK